MNEKRPFILIRKGDRIFLQWSEDKKEIPVKLVWARPLSDPGNDISMMDEHKKEAAFIHTLSELDIKTQELIKEEIQKRYLLPQITRVIKTEVQFGNRYWKVETKIGARAFAMREPHKNIVWVNDDRLILQDTLGNRYEIPSLSSLDLQSKIAVEQVI